MTESSLQPFLKWPGGKRWFVERFRGSFAVEYQMYIEPFVGSGAVFFELRPDRARLGDTNEELISTYQAITRDWKAVWDRLRRHQCQHSDSYYYRIRASRPRSAAGRASRFIYLNRTCFNGMYRVNLRGEFNVPRGTKNSVIMDNDDFRRVAHRLTKCKFYLADFETLVKRARRNDLIYLDPPYTVKHNNNNFIKYNEHLFSWADQQRLAAALKEADRRGATFVLSNADHISIRKLYNGFATIKRVSRASVLAADKSKRRTTTELVISNMHLAL